jgi:hypothetical protein
MYVVYYHLTTSCMPPVTETEPCARVMRVHERLPEALLGTSSRPSLPSTALLRMHLKEVP